MNALFEAGLEVQRFFEERGWRFCFIGGLAVVRWGEPRATQDVDVSLLTGFGQEEAYVQAVLSRLRPRRKDAASFALSSRVLLAETPTGIPVDISLAGFPFEAGIVDRASPFDFSADCRLITCSAEDLVVMKAFAGRQTDWADITTILRRQRKALDRTFVADQLEGLCDLREDLAPLRHLKQLMEKEK